MQGLKAPLLITQQEGWGDSSISHRNRCSENSDAVEKYQITSDEQRESMSRIIVENQATAIFESEQKCPSEAFSINVTVTLHNKDSENCDKTKERELSWSNIGGIIDEIIEKQSKSGNTVIKIQLEITRVDG